MNQHSKKRSVTWLINVVGFGIVVVLVFSSTCLWAQYKKKQTAAPKQPNIIFILTDDLGIGDLGVFFQNQRRMANDRNKPFTVTPYLDDMAKKGAMLDQYCAAPVCAPSRASLLLGQNQGHANVRDNQFDKALANNYTIGNVMQMAGYKTAIIGKWGLQGEGGSKAHPQAWPAYPLKRGFDTFLGYVRHIDGHEHYPKEGLYSEPKEVYEGYKEISNQLDKCYTGDLFTAYAKKYIVDHQKGKDKDQPFFMYLAYDTPHAVLELPTQAYPAGFGLHGGLQWTGKSGEMINTANGKTDSWLDPEYAKATYDDDHDAATAEVPWPDVYKRYATINKRIDNQVHDVLMLLKDLKIDKNTMVVFTSDNGPSIESYLNNEPIQPTFFESFGQFDGIKRDVWEGGIRMPTIAYWPTHIAAGLQLTDPSIAYDWMPTFLDVANQSAPVISDGVSLLPELLGNGTRAKSQVYVEYFESGNTPNFQEFDPSHRNRKRGQMQMLRLADTVAIRYDVKSQNDDFEIYNINKDPKQSNNLAKSQDLSAFQKRVKGSVLQMRLADKEAPRPYDNALIPAEVVQGNIKQGWKKSTYQSNTKWIAAPKKVRTTQHVKTLNFDDKENAVLFDGYLKIPEDGTYTFSLNTDNKAFVRLHAIALLDEDFDYQPGTEKSQTLHLAKGYHHMKLFWKKKGAKASISFKLSKEDGTSEHITDFMYSAN